MFQKPERSHHLKSPLNGPSFLFRRHRSYRQPQGRILENGISKGGSGYIQTGLIREQKL